MNQRRRLLNLKVRAYDLGTPSLHTEVEVRIFVLDRNDHGPKFEKDLYTVKIREDTEGGTPIIKVSTRCTIPDQSKTHDIHVLSMVR